jgi:hypothetical protein
VTPAEAEKIKASLEILGCAGGKMEKETEGRAALKSMTPSQGRAARHQARQGLQDDRDDARLSLTRACSAV